MAVSEVKNCTGCTACAGVCPENAIAMHEDGEGFLYPFIDNDKCTGCGLCENTCPVLGKDKLPETSQTPTVYAAWINDSEIRRSSSSGGVFSALALKMLNQGGVVFGAGFDEDVRVCHKAASDTESLAELRGSKYVQSSIGDSYVQAKKVLADGGGVLFSGVPCQVAGLYATLGGDSENLVTCDLICHGVPSPKVYRKYLDYLQHRYRSKVQHISFRDKRAGWNLRYRNVVNFDNGRQWIGPASRNPFMVGFSKNMYLRPSCHTCAFKGVPCVADITIADFWGIALRRPELDDGKGTSLVLVNTEKGKAIFDGCSDQLFSAECPFEYVEGNTMLMQSVPPHRDREKFFADLDNMPFEMLVKKYMKPRSLLRRIASRVKRIAARAVK